MTADILPRDEFSLDLLCTCLARMFEYDRRQRETAAVGNVSEARPATAADDAQTQKAGAQGDYTIND